MWPFSKKPSFYDTDRAALGMDSADKDDLGEFVNWVIVREILSPEVQKEKFLLPNDEQDNFMAAYSALFLWFLGYLLNLHYPQSSWDAIAPLVVRELAKKEWYDDQKIQEIINKIDNPLDRNNKKGKYFGADLGPWMDIVSAANQAGIKLSYSTNPQFLLSIPLIMKQASDTIIKTSPSNS